MSLGIMLKFGIEITSSFKDIKEIVEFSSILRGFWGTYPTNIGSGLLEHPLKSELRLLWKLDHVVMPGVGNALY